MLDRSSLPVSWTPNCCSHTGNRETVPATRSDKLPRADFWHILVSGIGYMAMAYLLVSIVDAAAGTESLYRHLFRPDAREIAVRLSFLCVLFLFIVRVLKLSLRRRRLEEALVKYQAGMDASVDGIAILNHRRECIYVNSAYSNLYGYGSHTELIGKPLRLFLNGAEIERFEMEILPALQSHGVWRGETIGSKRDGSVFPQDISMTSINGNDIVCIVRDITERKNIEGELKRQACELSATNRELEAFGYSLTHDMRSHITRSSSAAQLILKDNRASLSESNRQLVSMICSANRDMEELIKDMLVLSGITRSEIRREQVDLGAMASEVATTLQLQEPERAVEFDCPTGLKAEGDPRLLKVALDNLIGNAWKYTRWVANARIRFGMVELHSKKTFFVRDNGMGFDMNEADHLFKPFHRLANAEGVPGTGIGLATVQRIVQRHGGEIWGEATAGKGANFYFTLPS